MTGDDDRDLPLHDEAKARSKWRGGETILGKDGRDDSGPASEIDDAALGGDAGGPDPADTLQEDLAERPPD
ncbi:MAG: hypothetical protein ACXW27_03370 [Allosphingosinicella sp.]